MTAIVPHHQRAQARQTMRKILIKFERDDGELAARAAVERPDGYPTGGTNGASGVSDRTGNSAIQRINEPNENGKRRPMHAIRSLDLLMKAAALLAEADTHRAAALPPVIEPVTEGDDWCKNCEKAGVLNPRGLPKDVGQNSALCRTCHEFEREHHQPMPRVLIRKKARGEKLYKHVVAAACAHCASLEAASVGDPR